MTTRLLTWTIFLIGLLSPSCNPSRPDNYPKDTTISNENGEPKDSSTFYFPTAFKLNGEVAKSEIDTFLLQGYSSSLFAFNEPVLYNFYQGHDSYRFLWLRSFHRPVVISIHKDGSKIWLTTKVLDRQPGFIPYHQDKIVFVPPDNVIVADSIIHPKNLFNTDRHASIVINETKVLSSVEWEKFDRILTKCKFWTMRSVDRDLSTDGAEWIIEAHLQDKYFFVVRKSPQDNFSDCGKYLIELSGLNEEIY